MSSNPQVSFLICCHYISFYVRQHFAWHVENFYCRATSLSSCSIFNNFNSGRSEPKQIQSPPPLPLPTFSTSSPSSLSTVLIMTTQEVMFVYKYYILLFFFSSLIFQITLCGYLSMWTNFSQRLMKHLAGGESINLNQKICKKIYCTSNAIST